jgi:methyltransferase (TIGR00027 family)
MESERSDALFHDPYARQLAGPEGELIVNTLRRGRATAWAMIVRTAVFDELIVQTVVNDEASCVMNLAAGLDARPWRLQLPASLRWYDVDLPDILDYKASVIGSAQPVCHYESVAADLTDHAQRQATLSRLGSECESALVVTEGLLIYLTPRQVGELATELARTKAARWWLIDLASPRLIKMLSRYWEGEMARGNAVFRFGPAEGTAFFEQFGWREATFRSALEEARRLHREMKLMPLWRFLGRFSSEERKEEMRKMSGFVLLERI